MWVSKVVCELESFVYLKKFLRSYVNFIEFIYDNR